MGVFTRSRTAKVLGGIALVSAGMLALSGCTGNASTNPTESAAAGFDFPIDCDAAEPAAYTPNTRSSPAKLAVAWACAMTARSTPKVHDSDATA